MAVCKASRRPLLPACPPFPPPSPHPPLHRRPAASPRPTPLPRCLPPPPRLLVLGGSCGQEDSPVQAHRRARWQPDRLGSSAVYHPSPSPCPATAGGALSSPPRRPSQTFADVPARAGVQHHQRRQPRWQQARDAGVHDSVPAARRNDPPFHPARGWRSPPPACWLPRARAAPTHPGAPPTHLGSLRWPEQLASGRAKAEESPPSSLGRPVGAASFTEAMKMGSEVYHNLKSVIKKKQPTAGLKAKLPSAPPEDGAPPPPPWTVPRPRPRLRTPERRLRRVEARRGLRSPPRAAPRSRTCPISHC